MPVSNQTAVFPRSHHREGLNTPGFTLDTQQQQQQLHKHRQLNRKNTTVLKPARPPRQAGGQLSEVTPCDLGDLDNHLPLKTSDPPLLFQEVAPKHPFGRDQES